MDLEKWKELAVERTDVTVREVWEILECLAGIDLVNLATGIVAQVNRRQRSKMLSNKALAKSIANGFTSPEHNAAAANIAALWKHAELYEVCPDRIGDVNLVAMKRFVCPFPLCGRFAVAYLTAKESIRGEHKVYSLELFKIETLHKKGNAPCGDATCGAL